MISREDLISELSRPLPDPRIREDDATLYSMHQHYIRRQAVSGAPLIVTYPEAAALSGKSEAAIRMAVSRRSVLATAMRRTGQKTRRGVYFDSLASWLQLSPQQRQEAVDALRNA